MKLFSSFLKQNAFLIILKTLIIIVFLCTIIMVANRTIDYCENAIGLKCGYKNYVEILKTTFYYIPIFIVLIPFIGTFTNRPLGWIFIQSYFYYLLINVLFIIKYDDEIDFHSLAFIFTTILLIIHLFVIIGMNMKKIRYNVYGISTKKILNYNILAFILGSIILLIHLLTKYKLYQ